MMPIRLLWPMLAALGMALPSTTYCQEPQAAEKPAAGTDKLEARPLDKEIEKELLESFLTDKAAEFLGRKTDAIHLKYIEPNAPEDKPGWGFDYAWKASKQSEPGPIPKPGETFAIKRMSYELAIDGSYTFDDAKNNQDLSTITADFKLSRGDFGKLQVVPRKVSKAYIACIKAIPEPVTEDDEALYDKASDLCAKLHGMDKKVQNESQRSYYYWLDFHGGVEANQDYSQTHTLFGFTTAFSYQPDKAHAGYNFFDLPFSWLRSAFGDGAYSAPYPSVMLGLDRVDSDEKDPRSALTNDKTFTRVKAEVAFATQLANIDSKIVRLTTSYRYYKELSAPQVVKAASLDEFDFFTASLRFPASMLPLIESDAYELFVSYTDGKLPFGVANDQTFEVGISTNIQALADFLGK